MDSKDLKAFDVKEAGVVEPPSSHSPANLPLRREKDSLDDFEHLGLDSSPLQEAIKEGATEVSTAARDLLGEINKGLESTAKAASSIATDVFDPFKKESGLFDNPPKPTLKMDSNLLQMGDTIVTDKKESEDKLDKFLSELTAAPSVPSHDISPSHEELKAKLDGVKSATQNFMDMEREEIPFAPAKISSNNDVFDRYTTGYSYYDPEAEANKKKPEIIDFPAKRDNIVPDPFASSYSSQPVKDFQDSFKDDFDPFKEYKDVKEPELPAKSIFEKQPSPVKEITKPSAPQEPLIAAAPKFTPPAPLIPEKIPEPKFEDKFDDFKKGDIFVEPKKEEKIFELKKEEKFVEPKKEEKFVGPKKEVVKDDVKPTPKPIVEKKPKPAITDAEAIFKKMGLVESLIYWRDPKKSGPVFGGILVVLLALTYFSLISVVAYLSLLGLTATISFRIYKNVVHAVQKTGDGHPFKDFLETDVALSQEKVKEIVEVGVAHINAGIAELRRLFLVEDLVDSIKFGVLLWCLTYLGAWFNGMTLVIISWVALFTLPKVYEANKTQIDANLDLVRSKLAEITSKVKAAIPIGKKTEEKKDQ